MSPDEQAAALEAMAPEKQIQQPVHSEAEVDIEEWSDVATMSEEPIQEPVHSERAIGALHSQMHAEAEVGFVESSDTAALRHDADLMKQQLAAALASMSAEDLAQVLSTMSPDEQAAALEAMAPGEQIQQPVHAEAEVDVVESSDVATVIEEPIQEPVHS